MSRAVPNQDSSPESFARFLNRLTHSPSSHSPAPDSILDPLAEDFAVSVSISDSGAAALNATRKRTLAPVRVSGQTANRSTAEASEISYERALRLHSRQRPVGLPEIPQVPAPEGKKQPIPSKLNRAQTEAEAISELRRAVRRTAAGNSKPSATSPAEGDLRHSPAKTTPSAKAADTAGRSSSRRQRRRHNPGDHAKLAESKISKAAPTPAAQPSHPVKTKETATPRNLRSNSTTKHSAKTVSSMQRTNTTGSRRTRNSPHSEETMEQISAGIISPVAPTNTLELEITPRSAPLAHRQSIVSIRLNAIESEQLRQRAAESGISVSAYMRSCVLEAEHLRSQVKQALAELRGSHLLAAPRLESPPPLFAAMHLSERDSVKAIRPSFLGFLSGVFAIVLGRFQR